VKTNALTIGFAVATLACASGACAQSAPQTVTPAATASTIKTAVTTTPTAPPPSTSVNTYADNGTTYIESAQPASLGDLARASRANRASQTKAVKIFDEQNMPHAPIAEGQQAPGYVSGSSGGRLTLIDFWASWCGPCRHALPGLKQLQSVYGDQVEVISVSEDNDEDQWHSFVDNNGMTWTQKFDEGHQMMRQYGATALPTYVLIGKDGHVVKQWVGDAEDQTLVDRMGDDLKNSISAKL
jgi:thiol-disulfide isomerase/thioredoxin